jgi:hypothetical protein
VTGAAGQIRVFEGTAGGNPGRGSGQQRKQMIIDYIGKGDKGMSMRQRRGVRNKR